MPRPTSGDADDARDAFDANAARARATGGVLVVDGIQIVANHHRSSSSLDAKDAPREITSDDVEGRLARAQSAPADAESGSTSARRRGWMVRRCAVPDVFGNRGAEARRTRRRATVRAMI